MIHRVLRTDSTLKHAGSISVPGSNRPLQIKVLMRAEYINILMCSNMYIIWLEQFTMCCWNAHNCWLIYFFLASRYIAVFIPILDVHVPFFSSDTVSRPNLFTNSWWPPFCLDITVMSYHSSIMIDSVLQEVHPIQMFSNVPTVWIIEFTKKIHPKKAP